MVIHGGFWRGHRTLAMTAPVAEVLAEQGFDTWNIEYRKIGEANWSATLSDVAAAFDHTRTLANEYGIDNDRVFLFGHSAGGQLAAWCAGRTAITKRAGSAPPAVAARGLVTAGAVLDLHSGARSGTGDDAVTEFLGGGPEEVPKRYATADPMQRTPTHVATRCVHSRTDERVPFEHSERYVTAAAAGGDDAALIEAYSEHTASVAPGHQDCALAAAALHELASTMR